jgi:curved DNA-binding protein CbpA
VSDTDRSHYRAMGLQPHAGSDEIRSTYLQLARTLHPDRFMDASPAERSLAERRMREVNAAWSVLGDPAQRLDYDRMLRAESESRTRTSTPPKPPPEPSSASARAAGADGADEPAVRSRHRDFEGRVIDDDEDDVILSAPAAFLLRRGPVIVMIMLALGLFVGTALAGPRDQDRLPAQQIDTTTTVCPVPGGC